MTREPARLVATRLTHSYAPPTAVLTEVDLALHGREAVALLGPNGAGKTTLLRACAGLLAPSSGEVRIDDVPLGQMSRREVAHKLSVVAQRSPDPFGFTALEFVLMGFHARSGRFSLDSDAQRASARAALNALEVAGHADRPMTQLSGGEAQRVVMARTLASQAGIWLLDEPTANLDLRHRIALLDAMRRHCDDGGCALAIVHDPNLVERWFDRVVMLVDGRVLAEGRPGDVLTAELFETAFGVRMRYHGPRGRGVWAPELDLDGADDVESDATARSSA